MYKTRIKILFVMNFYINYFLHQIKENLDEMVHSDSVQQILDTTSASLFAYFSYIKFTTGDISIHSWFEAFFFYFGGSLTLAWGLYRALSARNTYLIQQQAIDFANGTNPKRKTVKYYIIAIVLIIVFIYFYAK